MKSTLTNKYQFVRAGLEAAIRSGEFPTGEQLPSEHDLAARFGVSYPTARRAVCELVEADLLERRARQGTFVRTSEYRGPATTTLNLVVPAYDVAFHGAFLNQSMKMAERQGWTTNVIRLGAGQQDQAVRAIRNGEMALVMLDEVPPRSALGLAMRAAAGRAISIGRHMEEYGIPSILIDSRRLFQFAVDHLRAHGHRDIVLVRQERGEIMNRRHSDAWHACMERDFSPAEIEARLIEVRTPPFECPTRDTFEAMSRFLAARPCTVSAIVSFGEEVSLAALAACRATGNCVPEALSLVSILDSPVMEFAHPAVTAVDVDFASQVKLAIEILEAVRQDNLPAERLFFVEPRLVARESVRSV